MLPRSLLVLPFVLLTGGCGVPLAVTAAGYGADGMLALTTDKTSTDHALSIATKDDCSVWRVFRHQVVCKDRKPGQKDPYNVNYDEPFRMGPDGYGPPLHADANAPARSWDQAAYKAPTPSPSGEPVTATAGAPTPAQTAANLESPPPPAPPPAAPAVKKKSVPKKTAKAKKPSPNQVASAH